MNCLLGCLMTVICFLLVGADAEASRRHRSKNQCNGETCSSPVVNSAQCSKPAQAVKKDCPCDNCKCQQCECDKKSKKK